MRRFDLKKIALFLLLILTCVSADASAVDFSKPIKEIKIEDNQRANENTIRFYIHSKVGERYSVNKTREDIRRIYALGYFDDIRLEVEEDAEGLVLIYRVKEKPFVKSIDTEGNKKVQDTILDPLLQLKKGTFFQKYLVKKDIKTIKDTYRKKGFYFTEVEAVIKDTGNNQVDILYAINEKQKVKISEIKFDGSNFFKNHELSESIETQKMGFLSFITDTGNFEKEILKTDVLRLESKYRDFGFIKAAIEDPRVEVDKETGTIIVKFVIREGDQYMVRDITAVGDEIYSAEEILEKIELKKGEAYNQSLFRSNVFDITEMYSNKGYAFASVIPDVKDDRKTKTVDINITVSPGGKVYIGKIKIKGNVKTWDNVVRREFKITEGELFSSYKLKRTRQRLMNTGFFESVEIDQKSGKSPDLLDLVVTVVEKSTGSVRAGVGYDSTEDLLLDAEISENNIFGSGRKLTSGLQLSDLREDYYIEFTEPRFLNRDILLGFELFSREFNYTSYDTKSQGGGVSIGRGISDLTHFRLGYRLENVKVDIDDFDNATSYLQSQHGTRITSSLTPSISKDTRDNRFDPTKGYRLVLTVPVAGGVLGGDLNFYKIIFDAKKHWSLPLKLVFTAHGEIKYAAAYDGQTLPLFQHYFLGGPTSLRGFSFRHVGPIDTNGESIGGDSSLLFNFEISYSFGKAVKGILFYDRGQVYGTEGDLSKTTSDRYDLSNMRHSIGFGLRLVTPVAPFLMAWGFKLDQLEGEPPMEFHLNIGYSF